MSVHDDRASELHKRATAQKRAGELDGAIVTLRQAYAEMIQGELGYTVDQYIRLPQFRHLAGRTKEAWIEFNKLLLKGYPKQFSDPAITPMERSKLLDKMRLFLEREGQDVLASIFGHFAEVSWCVGLFRQERRDELAASFNGEAAQTLMETLTSYKGGGCIKDLCTVIATEFATYPRIDYRRLGDKIDAEFQKQSAGKT